jgi:polyphosphate kinase
MTTDLKKPELYISRELSWCEFNHRVLEEAKDPGNPLLERFRFAAIVASNLDEFFMVRVASLKHRLKEGDTAPCPAGLTPSKTLEALSLRVHEMVSELYRTIHEDLLPASAQEGLILHSYGSLSPRQQAFVEERFENEIFPVLTPMAIDPTHPFPILINLSLNIAVLLPPAEGTENERLAIVPIPSVLNRLIRLPDGSNQFILLEEVVAQYLGRLFTGQRILDQVVFRITRDAELELDDEGSPDLLQTIELELKKRRTNAPVRLEIEQKTSKKLLQTFSKLLEVKEEDLYLEKLFIDIRFLSGLADIPGMDHLRFKPLSPQFPVELEGKKSIWPVLREGDILLHHPYESFEPVVQLIREAAEDPDVLAIKQTLYRTSGDSPIIRALTDAALTGKQVTVLVELTARFDEERNIGWARQLEKAGVHVIYGLVGLKTHAKILLIVRREKDGIRRYVHLGTGNYNDRTARAYTDIGLITSEEAFGVDASGFFNTITGYSDPPIFKRLTMAPLGLREKFLHLIERETVRARSGQFAMILAKMNSLVDSRIIEALYEASQAGVQIKLAVRGVCCLRPGIKGVSDSILVLSIVDRFLEHSRIFYFSNGGDEEYYCSSADWMPRNLDRRVELLFPVMSKDAREKVRLALDLVFSDNVKARILQADGSYIMRKRKKNEEPIRAQEAIYQLTLQSKELPRTVAFKPEKVSPAAKM